MPSVSVYAHRPGASGGKIPLYIRCQHQSTKRRLSLGIKVPKSDWNAGQKRVRQSHRHADRINRFLSQVETWGEDAILQLRTQGLEPTAGRIKERVQDAMAGDTQGQEIFLEYAEVVIQRYRKRGQEATANRHDQWRRKLRAMREKNGRSTLVFEDLTPALLERFRTYLREQGLAENTVAKHLKGLRTILYQAMREGRHPQEKNPFFHLTISETQAQKTALTKVELQRFRTAGLEAEHHRLARDCFVFAVLAQGVRVSDQMQLQNDNVVPAGGEEVGRIEYEMQKSGKAKSVRLVPKAREILRRWWAPEAGPEAYVFPYLRTHTTPASVNAYYNRQLQSAAEAAGITKHLTAHVARHTFANIAISDDWSIQEIQAALGHSTLRTTQQYIQQLRDQDLDDRMRGTFG